MNAKLIKFAVLAAGAYVVAAWAASKMQKRPLSALPSPSAPPAPAPPSYPTDPDFCYKNPDHPKCLTFVGI